MAYSKKGSRSFENTFLLFKKLFSNSKIKQKQTTTTKNPVSLGGNSFKKVD